MLTQNHKLINQLSKTDYRQNELRPKLPICSKLVLSLFEEQVGLEPTTRTLKVY